MRRRPLHRHASTRCARADSLIFVSNNAPLLAERATPFNRIMGDAIALDYPPPQRVNIDWAALCYSGFTSGGVVDTKGIRRINEMYLGEGGRYAFNNRSVLDKRAVRQLPAADARWIGHAQKAF